jgi:uncharacterized protein YbbC (DUF1343 family)
MNYSLPVKPSPNLPNDQAVNLYEFMPLKGTNVSVGRGTGSPVSTKYLKYLKCPALRTASGVVFTVLREISA